MRGKKLLVAFLLGVGLCFVPALGYGEVEHWADEAKASLMDFILLQARVDYMMRNPTNFLNVSFYYDSKGRYEDLFPEGVHTKGKIYIDITDNRGLFSYMSGTASLDQFKRELEVIYSFIDHLATSKYFDIVAAFRSEEEIPLGYFYQGEYHLWEE